MPVSLDGIEDNLLDVDLSGVVFTDVDGDPLLVTLTTDFGAFLAPVDGGAVGAGVVATLVDPTTVTFVGSQADINLYFDTVSNVQLDPVDDVAGNGLGNLAVFVSDLDGEGQLLSNQGGDMVLINLAAVNDDPTASSIPTDINVVEGMESQIDLSGFTLADVDSADHIVTITVDTGVFTTVADGSTVSPTLMVTLSTANFQTISLSGTPADINSYLNNPANITYTCLLYTSPSPRDQRGSRMPSSA